MAESQEKFCVVHFKIDDSVEAVPIKWLLLSENEQFYCKFPPSTTPNVVKLCANPDKTPPVHWKSFEVEIIKRYGKNSKHGMKYFKKDYC